jgi:signal transduction histidine kinase
MFSAFIFACGTTHFINIMVIWRPAYRLDASLMSVTAFFSAATLISLVKLMPQLLKLPSPSALRQTIYKLEDEINLRAQAENSLRELNVALDAKVLLRTQDLTQANQQLAEAKLELESKLRKITSINQELNNFANAASHDLKTPLRGIDQLATWIEEDLQAVLDPDTRDHLRLMRSRISRMDMLLDDLLAYSQVGRTDEDTVEIDTLKLVEDIYDLSVGPTQIKLIAENLPTLRAKKVPLELVFRNLIGNAIKHHDKVTGTVTVSAKRLEKEFEFTVQDDGPGIAPEHQQRVFIMFQTLKPRDKVEGSGMGLALVQKAIESVGGSISLQSDGQHGSLFRFTWPDAPPSGVMR